MSLTVWDPFHDMETLLDKYGRTSRKTPTKSDDRALEVGDWMPIVDIDETPDAFHIRAELPGVHKEDINVAVDNNVLTIKGEKKKEKKDRKHHRTECVYGSFVRSFTLPHSVNADGIHAKYHNGALNLNIPKAEEVKPRQIKVNVN